MELRYYYHVRLNHVKKLQADTCERYRYLEKAAYKLRYLLYY